MQLAISTGLGLALIGTVAAAVIGFFIYLYVKKHRHINASWKQFAQQYGFEFTGTGGTGVPTLRGMLKGVPVLVTTEFHYVGQERDYFTIVRSTFAVPLPQPFALCTKEQLGWIGGGPDATPLNIPEESLSDIVFWGENPPRIKALVQNPNVVKTLGALARVYPLIEVAGNELIVREHGVYDDFETLDKLINDVVRLNMVLSNSAKALS